MKNVSQNTAYVFFLVDCSSLALYFAKDISMAGGFLDHLDTMQLLKEEYIYIYACIYIYMHVYIYTYLLQNPCFFQGQLK